ncbi:hypothetical protein Mgrana_00272 [Meiothermus granaticius NBRC 107808]|uniref:Uncharacterized protein n=2 Tax=Meiothermus TaxID=65551 RepID=A0A399FE08_9DEIN|nr:hypothetical protein Mgrana_00272 [Meiothermus granaticius NBRC 107808]
MLRSHVQMRRASSCFLANIGLSMETVFGAVLASGVGLMGVSLYLGKMHEAGRSFAPSVRRGLFWACTAFMLVFAAALMGAGLHDTDAYRFVMGAVVAYLTGLFIRSAGGPAFTQEGRFPFSSRVEGAKVKVPRGR